MTELLETQIAIGYLIYFTVVKHDSSCVPVSCTDQLFCISVSERGRGGIPPVWECEVESGKIKPQFNSHPRERAVRMFAGRTVTFDPDPPTHIPPHRFSSLTSPLTNESSPPSHCISTCSTLPTPPPTPPPPSFPPPGRRVHRLSGGSVFWGRRERWRPGERGLPQPPTIPLAPH